MNRPITRVDILGSLHPEARGPAAVALDSLMPDEDDITAVWGYRVLHFVWYELPVKWPDPPEILIKIAVAVAAVMRVSGRVGLAETIESDRTTRLHTAWRTDRASAFKLYRDSMSAAGIDPPNTHALVWSSHMGMDEVAVHLDCSIMLEEAISAESLIPGRHGWRRAQARLVQRWLSRPNPAYAGRTPLRVVHAERHSTWLSRVSPDHYALLAPVLPLLDDLDEPPAVPDDVAAPLRWLLTTVGDGLKLTQAGYLPRSVVEESKHWYSDQLLPGHAVRKENDLPPLIILREWANSAKLVRVRKGMLLLTPLGRSILADRDAFNAVIVDAWFSDHDAIACAGEIAAAMLLRGPADTNALAAAVFAVVAERFHVPEGGLPSPQDCQHLLWEWLCPGNSLGFLAYRDLLGGSDEVALTDVGRAAAIAGLAGRAHAPVDVPASEY